MYLKSIEVQGFKSFAGKTELDFSQGITAIVGPNGSGKSNISDAVRWVLGEQKVKQLRGVSMQDVIFAGTQTRKPVSYAYVSLTLDNHDKSLPLDYDEITVTRRLYRSGESEYKLNGTSCRLKDIHELFYDTGIGKDGYSIIGQGQIDRILSGKPEERRALFDEAVGIVKYKRRKDLAQRKLEDAQQNLSRLNDILAELEKQVEPLRQQSEKAREYLRLRDELILYECNLFIREMDAAIKELEAVSENENAVNEDLQRIRQESEELSRKYDEVEEKIRERDAAVSATKEEIAKAELLQSNLQGQIDVVNERISAEKSNAQNYARQIQAFKKEQFKTIAEMEDNLAVLKWIREQFRFIRESGTGDVAEEDIALNLQLIENALKGMGRVVESCMGEDFRLEERPFREADQNVGGTGAGSGGKASGLIQNLEERREKLRELQQRLAGRQEDAAALGKQISGLEDEAGALSDRLSGEIRERDVVKSRLESLRNLAERYEGYGNAVKMVMDRRERVKGIEGVVSDLIQVSGQYEVAIETVLAGSVQNIVTRDEQTAKEMLQFLKQNRYGRATFLPLSNLRGRRDEQCEKACGEKGAIGLGCDLIQYAPEHRVLAEYLLGRVLVADNIDNALAIARKYRQRLRIVTLEGDLLNPGGSISGGAYRNNSSLMGRKRELEALEERILSIEEGMEKTKREREALKSRLAKARDTLEAVRKEISELEIQQNTASLGIASEINVEYSSLSTRTDFVTENMHRLSSQLERVFTERLKMEETQAGSDSFLQDQEEKIRAFEEHIRHAREGAEALSRKIAEAEAQKEQLLLERKSFFGKKDAISEQLLSMEKEALRVQSRKEKFAQKMDSLSSYMLEEYDLSYQSAKERYDESFGGVGSLRKMVSERKGDIRKLGSINIDSIEQYKEISERYGFLNGQHEDLVESEADLKKVIKDLDDGMRKQFRENFLKIQEQFDRVFKVLFGGGQGRIELDTEDPDVLTTGIHIVAEPPGKKLQNMMQLSGGEKALTAITLLFAIQALKPSPFCLLDEIEAALDDSNVLRFVEYLRKLTDHTQFIVITHRRGTMEHADRLFGITMQEKGISALVSVDLVQDQLDQ